MKKIIERGVILFLIIGLLLGAGVLQTSASRNRLTIHVPGDYDTISEAIDAAEDGDTIFVHTGTYEEGTLMIDKEISLIGENKETTIIRSYGYDDAIELRANFVRISRFTLQSSGDVVRMWDYSGISITNNIIVEGTISVLGGNLPDSDNVFSYNEFQNARIWISISGFGYYNENVVRYNQFSGSDAGVIIGQNYGAADKNRVYGNTFTGCSVGIIIDGGSFNRIVQNTFNGNEIGVMITDGLITNAYDNAIYHNNFKNSNQDHAIDYSTYINKWDHSSEGNYWDDYTPPGSYPISGTGNGVDRFPFDEENGWIGSPGGKEKCQQAPEVPPEGPQY